MKSQVDLRQLAVRRDGPDQHLIAPPRRVVTRYLIPLGLLLGFAALIAWTARELYLPRIPVTVIPVITTRAAVSQAGTPLFKAAGWVEPRPTPIHVTALSSGVVQSLLVVEDQQVIENQPVAFLYQQDAKMLLDAAKAKLQLSQAELEQAKAELQAAETNLKHPVHLEAAVAEAAADLAKVQTAIARLPFEKRQAEADLSFAIQNLESLQKASAAIAGVHLQQAQTRRDAAQAKVDDLEKHMLSLEAERLALAARHAALKRRLELKADEVRAVESARAKVDAMAARLKAAEVELAEAELRLDRMTIRAPVSGRVLRLVASPGSHVGAGKGAISNDPGTVITMYKPDSLQIRVDVRFDDLRRVQRGQPVRIESAALPKPLTGKVLFISSMADIQKNTLEVKVGIESPPPLLKPEMLVDVTFLAPESEQSKPSEADRLQLLIPKQLVLSDDHGKYVWVADLDTSCAIRQPVETGAVSSDGMVQIVNGLSISDRLIVSGRQQLSDGSRIRIVGEDQSTLVGTQAAGKEGF